MTDKFVYLRDGTKVRVLHRDDEKIFGAIQVMHERDYGDNFEKYEDDGQIVQLAPGQFFDLPPTAVLSDEVVRLEALIKERRAEINKLNREVKDAETAWAARMEGYARFSPALDRLDEFINEAITHYVVTDYGLPEIFTLEQTLCEEHHRHGQSKIFRLWAQKDRDGVKWTVSKYYDGSGSERDCVPCTSLDEAKGVVQAWLDKQRVYHGSNRAIVKLAKKYGLSLPDGFAARVVENEKRSVQQHIEQGKEKARQCLKQLEPDWKEFLGE